MAIAAMGPLELLILTLFGGSLPLGLPPLPEDRVLVSAVPEECLFYFSSYGMATPDGASKNRVERLLAEPEVRYFLSSVWKSVGQAAEGAQGPAAEGLKAYAIPLGEILLTRPWGLHIESLAIGPAGPDIRGGLVVHAGAKLPDTVERLRNLEAMLKLFGGGGVEEKTVGQARLRIPALPQGAPRLAWGSYGEYLVIGIGDNAAESIVTAMEAGRGRPEWLSALHRRLPVARPSTVHYVNVRALGQTLSTVLSPQQAGVLDALGVAQIKHLACVTGLDENDQVSQTHIAFDETPKGLLALLDAQPLQAADLAPIPHGATWACAFRLNAADGYRRLLETAGGVHPQARAELEQQVQQFEGEAGFGLQRDLLSALGDVWCFYGAPGDRALLPMAVASVQVRDRKKLLRVHEAVVRMITEQYQAFHEADGAPFGNQQPPDAHGGRPAGGERHFPLRKFEFGGNTVYYFDGGTEGALLAPSWCLTENALLVGLYPQAIKAHLARQEERARGGTTPSLASAPEIAAQLRSGPLMVSYQNTPELVGTLYPMLTAAAPLLLAELRREGLDLEVSALPSQLAVQRHLAPSWSACRREHDGLLMVNHWSLPCGELLLLDLPGLMAGDLAGSMQARLPGIAAAPAGDDARNLQAIGVAMHNYYDAFKRFPAYANFDAEGKPLLSWRVHLLPYLGEEDLYRQFKLDEPWDSEHNQKLIARMPRYYRSRGDKGEEGKTRVLVPVGTGALFSGERGARIAEITDGTSRTVMALIAAPEAAVPWTKPEDWKFSLDDYQSANGGYKDSGMLMVLMADGSVKSIDLDDYGGEVLHSLFTKSGGEEHEYEFLDRR